MKEIKWLSDERIIPNLGVFIVGKTYIISDDLANRFIAQGEAEEVKLAVETRRKHREGGE